MVRSFPPSLLFQELEVTLGSVLNCVLTIRVQQLQALLLLSVVGVLAWVLQHPDTLFLPEILRLFEGEVPSTFAIGAQRQFLLLSAPSWWEAITTNESLASPVFDAFYD